MVIYLKWNGHLTILDPLELFRAVQPLEFCFTLTFNRFVMYYEDCGNKRIFVAVVVVVNGQIERTVRLRRRFGWIGLDSDHIFIFL